MAGARKNEKTESFTFRLTPDEKSSLEALVSQRAEAAEEQGSPPPDRSAGAWLRWMIRREAKAAGISLDGTPPATQAPAKPRAKPRAA